MAESDAKLDAILRHRFRPGKASERRKQFKANYASVHRWLVAIRCNPSRDDGKGTQAHYLNYLIRFCWWYGKNPDQIIAQRIEDMKSSDLNRRLRFETLVMEFYLGYEKQNKLVAARESAVALKSFFKFNSAQINIKSPKKVHEVQRERLTIEEVKKMLEFCDVREKALILVLLQSGMRPQTVTWLSYGHVRIDLESGTLPVRIRLTAFEVKGKYAPYTALLGKDACKALKRYLDYRRRGTKKIAPEAIRDSSPLFRQISKLKPITYEEIRNLIKKVRKAAGIEKRVTPYAFRRTFQTIMERHLPAHPNWVDHLMGHIKFSGAQGDAYSRPTIEELTEAYKEAEPFISVSETLPIINEKSVKMEMLRVMARFCGVNLDEILEKREIKSLDEMTDEDVEALYKEYRKALRASGVLSSQLESRNTSDVKKCMNNFSPNAQVCPNCNSTGRKESDKFCGMCGNPLKMKCPKCGKKNSEKSNFCTQCGAKLACS